ncbi:MAG: 2-deoxy-D-gluconate 3-dehydrogenase [Thermoleophilia bacterium]|nr:2-deoxy-D-gluconate 3-dehydrogenase [Thermoleophilia bacterium]
MIDFRLDGRTALVTGAGRGLGRAIADALAELGATVYGTSRDEATADTIAGRYGTSSVVLDLLDVGRIRSTLSALLETAPIDLLVNNAGVNVPQRALDVDPESWNLVYDTNVRGAFFTSQTLASRWIDGGIRGTIVNVSSQAGTVAIEDRAAYGSSKAALAQLTRVLALEWAPKGIRVNAIAPTFVRTELTESTLSNPEWAKELLTRIPVGRFGEPDDIVGAVAFLSGSQSKLVTGHILLIDGGYTIR